MHIVKTRSFKGVGQSFKGDNQLFTRALRQKQHFPTEAQIPHYLHGDSPRYFFPDQALKIPIIGKIPHF